MTNTFQKNKAPWNNVYQLTKVIYYTKCKTNHKKTNHLGLRNDNCLTVRALHIFHISSDEFPAAYFSFSSSIIDCVLQNCSNRFSSSAFCFTDEFLRDKTDGRLQDRWKTVLSWLTQGDQVFLSRTLMCSPASNMADSRVHHSYSLRVRVCAYVYAWGDW